MHNSSTVPHWSLLAWSVALALLLQSAGLKAEIFRSYHIGNSLSVDTGAEWIGGRGAPGFESADSGYHIKCAQNLSYIVDNPEDVCIDDKDYPGYYSTALPAYHWNAITLQPYSGRTGAQELQAAATLINIAKQNVANVSSRYYILATWPSATSTGGEVTIDFQSKWLAHSDDYSRSTTMRHERGWYEWYVDELRADLPDTKIDMIPVGDVVLAIDAKLRNGDLPGIDDASSLFRDSRHFNNAGRMVAQLTAWSTIHRASPLELDWLSGFGTVSPGNHGRDLPRTEELSLLIRETIWEVLTEHQYAGVIEPGIIPGDFNRDGIVDAADYTVWRNSLGMSGENLEADGVRNGVVDEWDYLLWKQNYGRTMLPSGLVAVAEVPEPMGGALVGLGMIFVWRYQRRRFKA